MATLEIGGKRVQVDDSFLKLPPEQQQATVDEIASSFAAEAPPKMAASEVAGDVAKSAGIGVAKGTIGLAGLPRDMSNLIGSGMGAVEGFVRKKFGGETEDQAAVREAKVAEAKSQAPNILPGSSDIRRSVEGVTGEFYSPKTTAGKYAQTVGEMVPAVAMGPGGVGRKVLQALGSGLASEGAGQLASGTAYEPYARVAGALVGGMAPDIGRKIVTPNPVSPERQRLVRALEKEGVTSLTAGQKTGSEALRYAESAFGNAPFAGGKANEITKEGQRQFTEAAMRRAGAGPSAAPEVLSANQQRLAKQFGDLSARNALKSDPKFANDLGQTLREYDKVLPAAQKKIVGDLATDIVEKITKGGGVMPGKEYQAARSRLSRMANNARLNDPDYSEALRGLRNALDDAMDRSIPAGSPDKALWTQTRKEYGAQKMLEKAASRAGEATAEGQIVPANLRNAVSTGNNRGAYARGEGDFAELARAGSGVMASMPQSGTAPRSALYNLGNFATAGALPAAAGRVLMSKPVQKYLANQLIGQPDARLQDYARISRVVNALLASPRE